jgi:type II secretory pathway pseudopilin PulG
MGADTTFSGTSGAQPRLLGGQSAFGSPAVRLVRRDTAFTLVELVMALAVMALATGLVVPALEGGLRSRQVWRASRQFAATLRHLRAEALTTGEIQQLVVSPEQNAYETAAFDKVVHLPSSATFISVQGGDLGGHRQVRVLFFPNGGTSGLEAVVGASGDPFGPRYGVTLDPLIGAVSVKDVQA